MALPLQSVFWGATAINNNIGSMRHRSVHIDEIDVCGTGFKVLMEVDDNSALIVNDLERILGHQLSLRPIHLANNIIIILIINWNNFTLH